MIEGYIPKEQRKTILFLGDDLRLPSGIGRITREIIVNTAHRYNYLCIGGSQQHPDKGKVFDLSASINEEMKIPDASVRVIPVDGYGDQQLVRNIINSEKIDGIFFFTDPRYWIWLFEMEHELRIKGIPLMYYAIWDDVPFPYWNRSFYASCDLIMGISKQSNNIHQVVLGKGNFIDLDKEDTTGLTTPYENYEYAPKQVRTAYVPHGMDTKFFFQILADSDEYIKCLEYKTRVLGDTDYKFVLFYNSRNIRRKQTSDIILAFKTFCDGLPVGEADKCVLLLHTQPIDENGTNLFEVAATLAPNCNIRFTQGIVSMQELNYMYNFADCTISIGSNEGWGLSSTESVLAGTPIINNVTGGLQDQMRFEDSNGNWIEFDKNFASNHNGRYKKHGPWAAPVFPSNRSIQGSVQTPYIFDDRCNFEDVAAAIKYWYNMPIDFRKTYGQLGAEWMKSSEAKMTTLYMCSSMIKHMDTTLDAAAPRKKYDFINASNISRERNKPTGICLNEK